MTIIAEIRYKTSFTAYSILRAAKFRKTIVLFVRRIKIGCEFGFQKMLLSVGNVRVVCHRTGQVTPDH